jgi:hypothetical protein
MPADLFDEVPAESRRKIVGGNIELLDFQLGFLGEPTPVGRSASGTTKTHMPVALDATAESAAAMVAACRHELARHDVSCRARNCKVTTGALTAMQ